ncbi:MAG: hypothetical protein ACSLFQ_23275 [Thermoanaerobaculia bacterium]
MPDQIVHLVRQIARELGDAPLLFPPVESGANLPPALVPLYSFSDGIELPFLRFARTDEIHELTHHHLFGEHWIWFGEDFGFTDYLCRLDPRDERLAVASWNREDDAPIEGTHANVLELLREEYSRFVENDMHVADLHVSAVPPEAVPMQVVRVIRSLNSQAVSGLSADLRDLPLVLEAIPSDVAIEAVRTILGTGATAFLHNVRPRTAG